MSKVFTKLFFPLCLLIAYSNITLAQTIILEEGFEGGSLPTGWTVVDADGDGQNWSVTTSSTSHSGSYYIMSRSWNTNPLNPNNYLITPLVEGATNIKYYFKVNVNYPYEHYAVMASTTGNALTNFQIIFEETATATNDWIERNINLPAGTKYVAFRHYNSTDQDYLALDDITIFSGNSACPPITNLTATVNPNNTVTLNWTTPPTSTWPSECDGDIYFEFYNGSTEIGYDDNNDLTSWITNVLEVGTHSLGVTISYWKNGNQNVCYAETVFVDVTIENEATCPAITNLTATSNPNNTVTLSWTNPPQSEWPSTDIDYFFYDGTTSIGYNYSDGLTSWTTPELTIGNHSLGVETGYFSSSSWICKAEIIYVNVVVGEESCLPIAELSATVNGNNVSLTWETPETPVIIFSEGFESGIPSNWTLLDADGNGHNWDLNTSGGENSNNCVTSLSSSPNYLNTNNYLITPELEEYVTKVRYSVRTPIPYQEHYAIMASTTGNNASDFTIVFEETVKTLATWHEKQVDLPPGTKYIAFRHFNSLNQWSLSIDNIVIYGNNAPITNPHTYTITRNNMVVASEITATTYTDVGVATGVHDYCVKAVYPSCSSEKVCTNATVTCAPITNLSATTNDNNVILTWNTPNTLPEIILSEDFESGMPSNWTVIDANGDGLNWELNTTTGHNSNNCVSSLSYNSNEGYSLYPDNYLITPLLNNVTKLQFWVSVGAYNPYEHYAVMVSTTGNNINDFTSIFEETMTNSENWYKRSISLPSGTKYIAFRHYNSIDQSGLNIDDICIFGAIIPTTELHTYTIARNGVEIASGLTGLTYTDSDLDYETYNYCIQAVYSSCTSETVCTNITVEEIYCLPVTNLNATVNNNNVNLIWNAPIITEERSYTITRDEVEIASGLTDTTYTDLNLDFGTHNYCIKAVYSNCTPQSVCKSVIVEDLSTCHAVNNLSATISSDNSVNLSWNIPPSTDWPNACTEDLAFKIYNGSTQIGYSDANDLTSWTTNILPNGVYTLKVVIFYYDNASNLLCSAEASTTATIDGGFDCPPVNNLSAIINEDNTAKLSWTNPEELPTGCDGNLTFKFYIGNINVGSSNNDNLTSWTTPVLSEGTHNLAVVIHYLDNTNAEICYNQAYTTVTIYGNPTCPPINNLSATVNSDNTVTLSWTNPPQSEWASDEPYYWFYDDEIEIGSDNTYNLNSWTTAELTEGVHSLGVQIGYYSTIAEDYICKADIIFVEVTITNVEEIKTSLFSAEIFPNPAKDVLNIVSDSEIISYELYDALGRLLINKTEVANTESIVNVSSLKHGIYMLKLNTQKGTGTFKLIIE